MKRISAIGFALVAFTLLAVAQRSAGQQSQSAEAQLGAAIHLEEAEGNYEAAIASYKKFLAQFGSNRPLAARAQYHLGLSYEKLGAADARKAYEEVLSKYKDQGEIVTMARQRLDALMARAAPRPPVQLGHRQVCTDCGQRGASISSDGRLLAMTDDDGRLVIRDLSTGQVKHPLPEPANKGLLGELSFAEAPVFSPDGRQVVYSSLSQPDLTKVDPAAKVVELFAPTLFLTSVEPAGQPKALVAGTAQSGYVTPVAWSPDGKRVLVTIQKNIDGTWEFSWVSVADGSLKQIYSLEWRLQGVRGNPSISPDGKYIAYSALATNPSKRLSSPNNLPAAPDSKDQHIYVLAADGSSRSEIVKGASINESPVWTEDGSHVLFVSNRSSSFALWSVEVRNGKAVDNTLEPVRANVSGRIIPVGMTRTGSLHYVPETAITRGTDVYIAQMESGRGTIAGTPVRLSDNAFDRNSSPAWSPDGKSIAFKRRQPDNSYKLVVRTLDTGTEREFTFSSTHGSAPIWFHDGKGLLTKRNSNGGQLYQVDLESGAFQSVESMAHSLLPKGFNLGAPIALSPDDKALYIAVSSSPSVATPPAEQNSTSISPDDLSSRIVRFDLQDGEQKQIWPLQASSSPIVSIREDQFDVATFLELISSVSFVTNLALSPDGRTLAMILEGPNESKLVRVGIDGTDYRELPVKVKGSMLAWTRDGREILFQADSAGQLQLMRIPAAGGKAEFTGLATRGAHLDVSPDGSRVAFGEETQSSEMWALDNLSSIWKRKP